MSVLNDGRIAVAGGDNCMLQPGHLLQHVTAISSRRLNLARRRSRKPPQALHACASNLLQSDPPPSPAAAWAARCGRGGVRERYLCGVAVTRLYSRGLRVGCRVSVVFLLCVRVLCVSTVWVLAGPAWGRRAWGFVVAHVGACGLFVRAKVQTKQGFTLPSSRLA